MPLLKRLINYNYNVNILIENSNIFKNNLLDKTDIFLENRINDFIEDSSIIISVLPNSSITYKLVNEINNINKQKYWIDLCSSYSKDVKKINKTLISKNISYIDAPVSGGPTGMKNGVLTTIVSGPKNTYENCFNIINIYSKKILYVSDEVGTSSKIKLANNTLLALNLISCAEILNLLEKDNIDIEQSLEFINYSSGRSLVSLQRYPDNILTNKYDYGFSYDLHKKDIMTFLNNFKISDDYLLKRIKEIYSKDNKLNDHTEITKIIK